VGGGGSATVAGSDDDDDDDGFLGGEDEDEEEPATTLPLGAGIRTKPAAGDGHKAEAHNAPTANASREISFIIEQGHKSGSEKERICRRRKIVGVGSDRIGCEKRRSGVVVVVGDM
jgi:hypothetical protein